MWRLWLVAVPLLLGVPGRVQAQLPTGIVPQGLLCRLAIADAERAYGIPAHLLAAIGRVESGRRDPVSGALHPWPWTVNAEGEGSFFDTKAQAIAAVRAMQARGVRSIDVGCGQINLMHHPDAFPNLELAFDPSANASYAARFLKDLFGQSGDWGKASGLYHSATPEIGEDYRRKVLAVWPEEQRLAGAPGNPGLAQAWNATLTPRMPAGLVPISRPLGQAPTRMIMLPAAATGEAPPGRGLDSYRAAPIGLAYQPPPRRSGG